MNAKALVGFVAMAAVVAAFLAAQGLVVRAQPVANITLPAPSGAVQLYAGCNNIALTFPDGTPSGEVVQAVTPAGMVESLWRHSALMGRFEGFNPAFPGASDLLSVNFLDAAWLCLAEVPGATMPPPAPPPEPTPTPPTPPLPPAVTGTQMVEAELVNVDLSKAMLWTGPGDTNDYLVNFRVYDPADPTTPLCDYDSLWEVVALTDPPPLNLGFSCLLPGDDFRAKVTVTLARHSGMLLDSDLAAAGFEWLAMSPETEWQEVILLSGDPVTPDGATGPKPDDPDLEFTSIIRFRSVILIPLAGP